MTENLKNQIRDAFTKASSTYSDSAYIQNQVSLDLINFVGRDAGKPNQKIIDIASGSGFISKNMIETYGEELKNNILQIDSSQKMCQLSSKYAESKVADIEDFEINDDRKFDIAVSSMGLQWTDLEKSLASINKILKSNGKLYFAIPCFYNFNELKTYKNLLGFEKLPNAQYSVLSVLSNLKKAGFDISNYKTDEYTAYYRTYNSFVKSLFKTGAHVSNDSSRKFNVSSKKYEKLNAYLKKFDNNNNVSINWQIAFYSAKKNS